MYWETSTLFFIFTTIMKKTYLSLLITCLLSVSLTAQQQQTKAFNKLNDSKNWRVSFDDSCTEDWQSNWFLDGLRADLTNTNDGMVFSAGTVNRDDGCHAVLWTKESFKGAVKIEYDYTRTDARTVWVNILYIQATGNGEGPYFKDISEWNSMRIIPSMRYYFNNMNALQVSYAAFRGDNRDPEEDYMRLRQYPLKKGENFQKYTEIPSAYFQTGLYKPGETYHITVIKTNDTLFFKVTGNNVEELFSWKSNRIKEVTEGRIGLRHMYTRSAMYKNFKIYQAK